MEFELEGEDGSRFTLGTCNKALFGRGYGFNTDDRTVSRRHLSFQLNDSGSDPPRVSFKVIGRNPIWVFTNKDATIRLFRKFDEGYFDPGDRFCLSGKSPFWFNLKKKKDQVTESESSESEVDFDQLDVSGIDPVKEFGFLVIGHEFDHYPKGMIRNVKNWEWFLEEPSKESSDEEETRKMKRKQKVFKDNEDDEWTGDSEDDQDLVVKMGKGKKPGYATRSRDKKGPNRDVKDNNKSSKRKKATSVNENDEEEEEEEEEDDHDETLGGFIVTDDEKDEEEEEENNEDEEEEFEEEEEDDDADADDMEE